MEQQTSQAETPPKEAEKQPEEKSEDLDSVLDSLTKEFEESQKSTPKKQADPPADAVSSLKEEIERQKRELQELKEHQIRERSEKGLSETVKALREVAEVEVGDRVLRGFINERARSDDRISKAYLRRFENPDAWTKVLKGLGRELAADLKGPDKDLTQDRRAAEAAVQGQKSQSEPSSRPDNETLAAMSDAEFAAHKRKLAREARGS